MMQDLKANRSVVYDSRMDKVRIAEYRFFKKGEAGFAQDVCVFSNAQGYGHMSDTSIIPAILGKENIDERSFAFLELNTHVGRTGTPSGHYDFAWLQLKREYHPSYTKGFGVHVTKWTDLECPAEVFDAFKHLIGDFLSLEETISRDNPDNGYKYAKYSDEQIKEEREFALSHQKWLSKFEPQTLEMFASVMISPSEAKKRGYKFSPSLRDVSFKGDLSEYGSNVVIVDLKGSHLLGQHSHLDSHSRRHAYGTPTRFSVWCLTDA